MGRYISVEKYVDVDIDMDDFSDEDLMNELQARGLGNFPDPNEMEALLKTIYQLRRTGQDYQQQLDELIWNALGKI